MTININEINPDNLLKIFNTVEDVVILINPDHTIYNINDNGLQLLNKSRQDIIGKRCYDEICKEDGPPDFCPLSKVDKSSNNEPAERYYEGFDKFFSLNVSPITDKNGKIVQYIDVMRDIDQIKRSELALKEKNEEIKAQNEELRESREEIEAQNEELKETKEEIVVQNEELQSNLEDLNKATLQLKDREERLTNAEQIAGMGSWEYKFKSKALWCSKGLYKIIGSGPKSFSHNIKDLISLAHPQDKKIVSETLHNVLNHHSAYKIEHKILNLKNKTLDVLSQGKVLYDKDDHEYKISGIILDITARKKAKDQLITYNQRLKALTRFRNKILHTSKEQVLMNSACKIVSDIFVYPIVLIAKKVNNPSKDIKIVTARGIKSGYSEKVIGSWGDNKYGHGPSGTCLKTGKPQLNKIEKPEINPWYNTLKEHEIKSIYVVPLWENTKIFGTITFYSKDDDTFDKREQSFLQGIANDLSFGIERIRSNNRRLEAETKLKDREEKLKEAHEIANIGTWEFDIVNNVLYWSEETYKLFEIKPYSKPVTYETFLEKVHPGDRDAVNNAYAQSLKNKKPYDIVHRLLLKNGKVKYVREKCRTEYDSNNKPIRSLGVMMDITDIKLAEQQMEKALEKEKEVSYLRSQFVSTVTHEFRTPLASIHSNTQLLQRYNEKWDQERKEKNFNRIYDAIKSLSFLLEDVSILGKEQSGRLQFNPAPTDIQSFIHSLAEEANEAYRNKPSIVIENAFTHKKISVDQTLLRHILINLFTNALRYSSANDRQPRLTISDGNEKNKINFVLKDYGKGISQHELKNIHEPFFRGSNVASIKGTGLGMSIVQKSVKLHKGTINIKSEEGKGTEVTVQLPFFDANKKIDI